SVQGLSRSLEKANPIVFYGSKSGEYEIARAIGTRDLLINETSIASDWNDTRKSLDFIAMAGRVLTAQYTTIEKLVGRGVNIRVILLDPDCDHAQYDAWCHAVTVTPDGTRTSCKATIADIQEIQSKISKN